MSVSLRRLVLVALTVLVPAGADAGCLFHPCGPCGSPWIGFSFGLSFPCLFSHSCGPWGCGPCVPPPRVPCGPVCPPPVPCGPVCPPPVPCGPVCPPPISCQPACLPPNPCGPTFTPPVVPGIGPSLPAPASSACNCVVPPVCTTLQPRQVTTYRTVPTIQYRREAYVENVPVTTYQQITVPRTVYQPQTRYRDVAYTVNQQVAETHTECVPQPMFGALPTQPMAAAPYATYDQSTAFGLTPQFASPTSPSAMSTDSFAAPPGSRVPSPIALPPTPPSQAATLQSPQPYAESQWQTVPKRQAQQNRGVQQMGGLQPAYAPRPTSYRPQASPSRSMFQPAPTAASVWQSRWMR